MLGDKYINLVVKYQIHQAFANFNRHRIFLAKVFPLIMQLSGKVKKKFLQTFTIVINEKITYFYFLGENSRQILRISLHRMLYCSRCQLFKQVLHNLICCFQLKIICHTDMKDIQSIEQFIKKWALLHFQLQK